MSQHLPHQDLSPYIEITKMHLDNQAVMAAARASNLLVAEPDIYDSIPLGYFDISDGEVEQVGGGRRGPRRSISPSNTTPTRLCSRIKPTSRLLDMSLSDGRQDKALASVRRAMDARQTQLPSESKSSLDEYLEDNGFEPLPLPPPPRPGRWPQMHSTQHVRSSEQSRSKDDRPCLSPFAMPSPSPSPFRQESSHPALSEKGGSPAPTRLPNTSSRSRSQQPDKSDDNIRQRSSVPSPSHRSSPVLMAPPSSPCSRNPASSQIDLSAHSRKLAEVLAANNRLAPKSLNDQPSAPSPGNCTDSETSYEPERRPNDHADDPAPSFNVNIIPPTPATQKAASGRPSKAVLQLYADKFEEVDRIFLELAEQCGRSIQKIRRQYNKHHSQPNYSGNVWNIYQRYFTEHLEQELARLPGQSLHPLKEPCSAAFSQFQTDHKDNWRDILTTWSNIVDLDTAGMTRAHRKKEFLKHVEALVHIAERGMQDGFETVFLCCGNVVNDDGQLGYTHTTEGSEDFWKIRFNRDEHTILGHLKAHVFNLASLSVIQSKDSYPEKDPVPAPQPPPGQQESDSSRGGQADHTTPELQQRRDTAEIQALQKALIARAQDSGLNLTNKSRQFPWKTMLSVLANDGYQLLNWPADQCPFPGAPTRNGRRGKGITGLLKEQILALQCSLQDPTFPLTFHKYSGSNTDLVKGRQPVIIGAPPKPDHQDRVKTSHGRRQFVDTTTY
ncbi:hypothetical protein JOM56_007116, partial [Amanita muscaria]